MLNAEWYGRFPGSLVAAAYRWHSGFVGNNIRPAGPRHPYADFEDCGHWLCRIANWFERMTR